MLLPLHSASPSFALCSYKKDDEVAQHADLCAEAALEVFDAVR
jgi:hypothetical protein